jgi:16S rRNA (guanine966-N2)-methyltransferase
MIRITGGDAKGRAIKVYKGGQVRPTSDKVRQAIFNILEHRYDIDFNKVSALDLYAGSGSLGLEMLSRGGRSVTFVEADNKAASVLRTNLVLVDHDGSRDGGVISKREARDESTPQSQERRGRLVIQRVERFLRRSTPQVFEIIFADPPYRDELGPTLLNHLQSGWISPESVVVIEHAKRDLFNPPPLWILDDRRAYGDTLISFIVPDLEELS